MRLVEKASVAARRWNVAGARKFPPAADEHTNQRLRRHTGGIRLQRVGVNKVASLLQGENLRPHLASPPSATLTRSEELKSLFILFMRVGERAPLLLRKKTL